MVNVSISLVPASATAASWPFLLTQIPAGVVPFVSAVESYVSELSPLIVNVETLPVLPLTANRKFPLIARPYGAPPEPF